MVTRQVSRETGQQSICLDVVKIFIMDGKNPKQIDIIKSQRAVIEKLQIQIDKMQEQARADGERFSEVLRIKNKLMDLLLEDRKLLQKKLEDIE